MDQNKLERHSGALTYLTTLQYLVSVYDRVYCLVSLHIGARGEILITMYFTEGGIAGVDV